jgi:hypothetical protein
MKTLPISVLLAFGLALAIEDGVTAGVLTPLDPNAYPSQGTLAVNSGSLSFNTNNAFNGVFDYDSISVASGVSIQVVGSRPLILLSRGDATIRSFINLPGGLPTPGSGGLAGGSVISGGTGQGGGPYGGVME